MRYNLDIIINLILYEHLQQQHVYVVADRALQALGIDVWHRDRGVLARHIFAVLYAASRCRGRQRTIRGVRLLRAALARARFLKNARVMPHVSH